MEHRIDIDRSLSEPVPAQIKRQIAESAARGTLRSGDRLPPVRELASLLQISPVTVLAAYAELEAAGVVERRPNRGVYIRSLDLDAPERLPVVHPVGRAGEETFGPRAPEDILSWQVLSAELPPPGVAPLHTASVAAELLPTGDLLGDLRAAVQDDPTFFGAYGPLAGEGGLRSRIAAYLSLIGAPVRGDDVLITSGAQQAVDLIARALVQPGDAVAIETPTYPAAIDVLRSRGARLHPIPVDAEGMQVERLRDIADLRLVYTVPDYHNPTGAVLSGERREMLVKLARERGFFILEDDPWREISFGDALPPQLRSLEHNGQVIHVKSLSKLLAAGIRLGAVVADGSVRSRLLEVKSLADGGTGLLEQWTIRTFMGSPRMERHLHRLSQTMARRRDVTLQALRDAKPRGARWTEPDGGFSIWVDLGEGRSAEEVCRIALQRGVAFAPGSAFFPASPKPHFLRLTYSAATEDEIVRGAELLGRILGDWSSGRAR